MIRTDKIYYFLVMFFVFYGFCVFPPSSLLDCHDYGCNDDVDWRCVCCAFTSATANWHLHHIPLIEVNAGQQSNIDNLIGFATFCVLCFLCVLCFPSLMFIGLSRSWL